MVLTVPFGMFNSGGGVHNFPLRVLAIKHPTSLEEEK